MLPDGIVNHMLGSCIYDAPQPLTRHQSIHTSYVDKAGAIGAVTKAVDPIHLPRPGRIYVEKLPRARWHAPLARLCQRATGVRSLVIGDGGLAARAAAARPVGRERPGAIGVPPCGPRVKHAEDE